MSGHGSWRRRDGDSPSSGYGSSTTVSSGGLYRNMPNAPPPAQSPPNSQHVSRYREWKQADPEEKSKPNRSQYLPCYLKARRSTFETDELFEVRKDETTKREVWIREVGFPSQALKEALAEAELIPLKRFETAVPVLIVTKDEQRKRGLLMHDREDSPVKYLDVDSGRVEKTEAERIFAVPAKLLSIPNAAIKCELDKNDAGLDHKLFFHKEALSDWTESRVHITVWAKTPTVLLSILEPNFDAKRLKTKPVQNAWGVQDAPSVQKLYEALPGIVRPPAFTLLKNCLVLHVEGQSAYIVRNDGSFEIDPSDKGDLATTPSLREEEKLFITGDCAMASQNELEMRVVIGDPDGSSRKVQSVDSGATYLVWDVRHLEPLVRRDPPKALKVSLPPEYYFQREEELDVLLRTGVFDVFFENNEDPPAVRLFTTQGIEMHVCISKKSDLDSAEIDDEDDRSLTRSARG